MLDDFDMDFPEDEDFSEDEGEASGPDRKFLMIAGGLGGAIILIIACIAGYWFFIRTPPVSDAEQTQTALAISAAQSQAQTQTAIAGIPAFTNTPSPTVPPTNTPTPTVAIPTATSEAVDDPGGPTADPRTATVQALLTQAALAQTQAAEAILTVTATPTSTALPDTGFADDVGVPALLGMAGLLILVIFVARRLREATA